MSLPSPAPHEPAPESAVSVYLTRHGRTMLNQLDRIQGWSDSPLTPAGAEVAHGLGRGLKAAGIEFEAVFCADMLRHYTTARAVVDELGLAIEPVRDARLREASFGLYEGAVNDVWWDAIAQGWGYVDRADLDAHEPGWKTDKALAVIKELTVDPQIVAETSEDVQGRAQEALDEIARTQEERGGGNVLVVSSGLVIQIVLLHLGVPREALEGGMANAAVNLLTYRAGQWSVETANDTSYVENGA